MRHNLFFTFSKTKNVYPSLEFTLGPYTVYSFTLKCTLSILMLKQCFKLHRVAYVTDINQLLSKTDLLNTSYK